MHIDAYFDTWVGRKQEDSSYARIAARLGLYGAEVIFVSDSPGELDSARAAGFMTGYCVRPGAVCEKTKHLLIHSFAELP